MIRPRSALSRSPAIAESSVSRYRSATATTRCIDSSRAERRVLSSAESDWAAIRRAWQGGCSGATRPRVEGSHGYHRPMLVRLDVRDARADLADRLGERSRPSDDLAVTAAVTSILDAVRTRGDAAVRELTAQFDHADIDRLRVDPAELEAAVSATPADVRDALEVAATRIRAYHAGQALVPPSSYAADGVTVTEAIRPVD